MAHYWPCAFAARQRLAICDHLSAIELLANPVALRIAAARSALAGRDEEPKRKGMARLVEIDPQLRFSSFLCVPEALRQAMLGWA